MSLNESLKNVLPAGENFEFLHLRSTPIECHSLVTRQESSSDEKASITVKTQHFLTLFHREKTIFGLELYVYITLRPTDSSNYDGERVIFVSKADTTGHADCRVNYRDVTKIFIQHVLLIDPNSYLHKVIPKERDYDKIDSALITKRTSPIQALRILSNRSTSSKVLKDQPHTEFYHFYSCNPGLITKVCLFTRPAPQYLFPESSKNPQKHVVDGQKLLKWWLRILDSILLESFQKGAKARIRIPGEDSTRVRRYLQDTKYDNWKVGDIFGDNGKETAIFHIPLFPDDPKARFLRQLVDENRARKTTLETFWTELQNRQEFRLSVTVSVIGLQGLVAAKPLRQASPPDGICPRKNFSTLKRYVTGEKYDTASGAIESYTNVRDYLAIKLNQKMPVITGLRPTDRETQTTGHGTNTTRPLVATTLQPRKKPKKVVI